MTHYNNSASCQPTIANNLYTHFDATMNMVLLTTFRYRLQPFRESDQGPLHTWDWEPVTFTLQALSLVEKAKPVQVRFTLRLRDQRSMWMQDGCKVYMDSYMAPNGSCYMVTWIIFKNHFLEVGLTRNWETMALWTLTTIGLFYFIMREDMDE